MAVTRRAGSGHRFGDETGGAPRPPSPSSQLQCQR